MLIIHKEPTIVALYGGRRTFNLMMEASSVLLIISFTNIMLTVQMSVRFVKSEMSKFNTSRHCMS